MPSSSPPSIQVLPEGHRLDGYQLRGLSAASSSSLSYVATDVELGLAVTVTEYFPAALARRDGAGLVGAAEPRHAQAYQRGLKAFADEARMLARCQHPSLASVLRLWHGHGTAYRVMPHREGQSLLDLRREMPEPPDEASLLALMDDLLEALDIVHRSGHAHGGVHLGNILLLADDRPLLLPPDWAAAALAPTPAAAPSAADDLYALSEVVRFCMDGERPASATGTVPHRYSEPLRRTLAAATSNRRRDRPADVAQYRAWLADGPPLTASAPLPAPAADDPNAFLTPEFFARLSQANAEEPAERLVHDRLEPTLAPSEAPVDQPAPERFEAPPRVSPPAPPKRRPLVFTAVALALLAAVGVGTWQAGVVDLPGAEEWQLSHLMKLKRQQAAPPRSVPVPAAVARQDPAEADLKRAEALLALSATPLPTEPTSAGLPASAAVETAAAAAPAPKPAPPKRSKAAPQTPRSACAPRTEFALYRCVQTQCSQKRWKGHAQCEAHKRG